MSSMQMAQLHPDLRIYPTPYIVSSSPSPRPITAPAGPGASEHFPHTHIPPILLSHRSYDGDATSPTKRARLQHKSHSIHGVPNSAPPAYSTPACHTPKRPLPPVPSTSPTPSPPPSRPGTPRTMVRPLPHPPTSTSDLAPARPAGPQRWASLPKVRVSTDTSLLPPHALEPPTPSPLSPIPLSPTTANRRRLAKLRRKLGESLPPQAIYGGEEEGVMITTLEKITQHQPMLIVSDDESDSDSDSEPGTDDVDNAVVNHVAQNLGARLQRMGATLGTSQSALIRRCSRQWVREKGGRRWAEHDYQDVLRSLRQL